MSQSLIENLNPEQRAAVEATEGPLLILAGAGSGKTRVITSRIAWLIQQKDVAPDSILAVTFTNKASAEMAERVDRLLGHSSLAKPLIATFHSLCVRMLRRDIEALKVDGQGLTRSFAIFDENDQQGIVKQIMRRMGLDTKQLTPRTVLSRISWAKNHMVDPQDYYLGSKDPDSERIAHIYKAYKDELRKNNALDFDDLLLEAVRLLKVSAPTPRALPAPLSLYTRRRVPGHQPSAIRVDEAAGRRTPRTSAPSATKTRASIPGAVPTSATSSSSKKTFPTPASSASSRTTAPHRSFWKPPARLSPTTFAAKARSSGPSVRAAPSSATTKRPTAKMKRSSSPTAFRNFSANQTRSETTRPTAPSLSHQLAVAPR